MHIVVVEPHPDDAFLSVGWHLEHVWREYQRTIVTVYSDEQRTKEVKSYAMAVGASSIVIGLEESPMSRITSIQTITLLRSCLAQLKWDEIVFPLGLQHPDHLNVAATRTEGAWRYLDTPYQTKQKLADVLAEKTEGMEVRSIVFPGARKWRHIPIWKSQAKFFHFNPMKDLRVPEIILCSPT
jgi:hypothetical protein